LKRLSGYGGDEQLLSTKVWLEGGRYVLLKDVVIGHWYRETIVALTGEAVKEIEKIKNETK